jgi:hypothetical protein
MYIRKFVSDINKLGASVGRPTIRHQTDRNRGRKSQRFAKLKEVFCQRTCRPKNTTFNFAQPHRKPTHHPTSGRLTI